MEETIYPHLLLSSKELHFYNEQCKTKKRKIEYYWGRIALKISLPSKIDIPFFKQKHIGQGIFNQPLLNNSNNIDLSLSHCSELAIAISFPRDYLIGIDVENIQLHLPSSIKEFVSKKAMENIKDVKTEIIYTVCWTSIEGLSKALKVGFTANPLIFSIHNISESNEIFYIEFDNFSSFIGYAFKVDNYVFSIILPKQHDVNIHKIKKSISDWWFEYKHERNNTKL
ncbi:4'-phosphopantetheinyl transferase family protein [Staphylococcus cohnii]